MKVCIEKSEDGQFSVGMEPMEGEKSGGMGMIKSGMGGGSGLGMNQGEQGAQMKPAKDLEDALNQARQLLAGGEGLSQTDMWNQVQRDRAMANQPGGPMMGR